MRIAVMGAGAVGGYFGGLLSRAGHEVTFVARGEHLRAMQAGGLTLETPKGTLKVDGARFVATAAELDACDVILFAVKAYDIEAAAAPLKPLVERGACIVSVLNGVDHQDRIAGALGTLGTLGDAGQARLAGDAGAGPVLGGLAMVSGVITAPGVVRYTTDMSALRFGEADGSMSPRALAFREACIGAGFTAEVVADIRSAQWTKFVALATNAAMCSLFRLPVGYIYHDPQIIPMTLRAFGEVAALARALGISVPDDIEQRSLQVHQSFPKTMYASMFHDLHKGRPLELESLSGYVVRKGRELGMPTPVHEMAYLALKPYLHGTPKPLA